MKILMTNNTMNQLGGSEMFVHDLSKALIELGNEVHVISYVDIDKENKLVIECIKNGVKFISAVEDLDKDYDIIHCHHNNIANIVNYRLPDIPKIFVSHGVTFPICAPNTDIEFKQIVAVSEEVKQFLESNDYKDVIVINNPIDTKRFAYKSKQRDTIKTICYASNHAGRMCKAAGVNCQAYERLKGKYFAEYCFTECQTKPAHNMLRLTEFCKAQLFVIGIVTFMNDKGVVEKAQQTVWDIENAYYNSDLVVGIGRSALIAMSMGVPTYVYDHYGHVGFIKDVEQFKTVQKANFSGREYVEGLSKSYKNGSFPLIQPYKIAKEYKKIVSELGGLLKLSEQVKAEYDSIKIAKQYLELYKQHGEVK